MYVAGTMKKCPFRRGAYLLEVKNVVFVCDWNHE